MARTAPAAFLAALIAAVTVGQGAAGAAERIETIPTRPGVTLKTIISDGAPRDAPIVILFAGGGGINLDGWDGSGNPSGNFLVRTRRHWAGHGLVVAVPDAPSDRQGDDMSLWRTSPDHATDIAALIRHLRQFSTGPVFLAGTSRGTISAAGIAAQLPPGTVAGIVLSATVTRYNRARNKGRVQDARLADIGVPVLLAHHRDDACYVTPPEDIADLAKSFARSPRVEIKLFEGGGNYRGDDCGARAAHGFRGIEKRVVADLATWIKAVAAGAAAR